VRPATLASAVETALRARRRQYEIRDRLLEREQAHEALRKSEKLAVAGKLAASIAHEINNPLAAVTNLNYLIGTSGTIEEARHYAGLAQRELARVAEITTQTLRFYRQQTRPARAQVAEIVDSVLALFQARLTTSQIVVERQYRRSDPLLCFAGELRQLVANLVGNAIDAMRSGGRLTLRVAPACRLHEARQAGVRVIIADTGVGILPELRPKLFEPFFTTKTLTGTGLGLWVSDQITRNHGGAIRFRSCVTPGKSGTVFSIFLPHDHAPSKAVALPTAS
jgi:signal transduction histidine kinase